MSAKKKGLGRGLDALLDGIRELESDATIKGEQTGTEDPTIAGVVSLPIESIEGGRHQPRHGFDPDSLRELADSIAAQGVIQPILVRPVGTGRYEIIVGERRWRASRQAGLTEIPVLVREVDEQSAIAIALIENIQREDLDPLEEAGALERLLTEFELTHRQVAEAVGKSRTTVTNLLRLLELNDDVKQQLQDRRLEMGHARALLGLQGPQQSEVATRVIAHGLSVRETEKLVRRLRVTDQKPPPASAPEPKPDPDITRLQEDLGVRLGARVRIEHGSRGTGKLVIAYNSLDELDGILAHIK